MASDGVYFVSLHEQTTTSTANPKGKAAGLSRTRLSLPNFSYGCSGKGGVLCCMLRFDANNWQPFSRVAQLSFLPLDQCSHDVHSPMAIPPFGFGKRHKKTWRPVDSIHLVLRWRLPCILNHFWLSYEARKSKSMAPPTDSHCWYHLCHCSSCCWFRLSNYWFKSCIRLQDWRKHSLSTWLQPEMDCIDTLYGILTWLGSRIVLPGHGIFHIGNWRDGGSLTFRISKEVTLAVAFTGEAGT